MERACDACGDPYEAKTKRSRFCSVNCRVANARAKSHAVSEPPPAVPTRTTQASAKLDAELEKLGVADLYEAEIAVGIARQLDSGLIVGAQYVSLSKELDRRVDALRLRAVRHDDPAAAVKLRLVQKQSGLA